MQIPAWVKGRSYKAVLLSTLFAAAAYLLTVLWTGWSEVRQAIIAIGFSGLAIALVLSLLNYMLRFVRWQLYLQTLGYPIRIWPSLRIYLAGFALTTTPGKAGELLRSLLLQRHSVPLQHSVSAFFSERLSDLLAVTGLAFLGFWLYPQAQLLIGGATLILLILYWLVLRGRLIHWCCNRVKSWSRIHQLMNNVQQLLGQVQRCHTVGLMTITTCLSLVAWAAEAWAFHLILESLGYQIPISIAVFIYAVSMLAGALSFMPGGLGGAEAMMIALLLWQDVPAGPAVAATVVIRLATLWFAVLLGLMALLNLKVSRSD